MATYEGKGVSAEVWRVVQERRGRKELRRDATPAMDSRVTPKDGKDRFADN